MENSALGCDVGELNVILVYGPTPGPIIETVGENDNGNYGLTEAFQNGQCCAWLWSVFSTLPERLNGCCFLPNAGNGRATSNHQRDNVIKLLSPCFCH